ncbi:MAG: polysaccharide biosynthesis/export family protein [bacterium]
MISISGNTVFRKRLAHKGRYILIVLLFPFTYTDVWAQSSSYQVNSEDRLEISFWENPELNTQVTVGKDGGIELPIIGRLTAAGLSVHKLREKIISQMAVYNKLITQLSIVVLEYGHNRVYVTGQVGTPGRFSFEDIPNLWDIILEAGGPLETALLDEVVIVRSKEGGKIIGVDLSTALRRGSLRELPKIRAGDTIHVPGTSLTGAASSPLMKRNEIYILGAVAVPGAHKFEQNLSLLEAISKAGGPTAEASLEKVKHISVSYGSTTVVEFNLEEYMERSTPGPMPVGAGDTIFVPRKRRMSPLLGTVITGVITTTITSVVTFLIVQ